MKYLLHCVDLCVHVIGIQPVIRHIDDKSLILLLVVFKKQPFNAIDFY